MCAASESGERGLQYPLTNATLTDDYPLGVSNAFTGAPAEITVGQGRLIVLWGAALEDSDLFQPLFEQNLTNP